MKIKKQIVSKIAKALAQAILEDREKQRDELIRQEMKVLYGKFYQKKWHLTYEEARENLENNSREYELIENSYGDQFDRTKDLIELSENPIIEGDYIDMPYETAVELCYFCRNRNILEKENPIL